MLEKIIYLGPKRLVIWALHCSFWWWWWPEWPFVIILVLNVSKRLVEKKNILGGSRHDASRAPAVISLPYFPFPCPVLCSSFVWWPWCPFIIMVIMVPLHIGNLIISYLVKEKSE